MEIKIEQKSGLLCVTLVGRLIAASAEDFTKQIAGSVETCPNVLCDLSQMTHIDSSGLGVLVRLLQQCKAQGGLCRLAGLQAHPRIVFDITKVSRIFEIFDTVEDAERAFCS